jgi:hypothetical protein
MVSKRRKARDESSVWSDRCCELKRINSARFVWKKKRNWIQCGRVLPLSSSPARELIELDAFVAAVGYHEEVVPGPYHPREPDEECRIHAQNCTRNRNVSNYRIYVETANLRHGNPHYVPPVILPDIISGGLLVSATLCKFKQDERFRLSEGWQLEIKARAATNYTTSCPIWTSVILQPHAAPSDHLFF